MNEEQQQNDQDFGAGFTSATDGELSPTPREEPTEGTNGEPVKTEAPPEIVQITRKEWDDVLARAAGIDEIRATQGQIRDTAMGRIGRLEQTLTELRNAAPAGQSIAEEDLAQLAAEYPDLAELNVFKKLRGTGNAAPALDEAQLAPLVDQRVARAREEIQRASNQELEMRLLRRDHPDWRQVVGLTDDGQRVETPYRAWLKAQPDDYQHKVGGAWDADIVGESIAKFKKHAQTEAARKAAADARQSRIAASVPARSDGGTTERGATAEDELADGFSTG
jgi:hypothetical protein